MEETLMSQATTPNEGEGNEADAGQQGTTDQQVEGEAQEQQEEQQPEGAPEKYELKALEGQEFDAEFLKTYEEVARELNLTNEKAQLMIDKISPVIEKQNQARVEAIRTEWAETSKVDKEFGGDNLKENLSVAKQALDKFGTPELKELINASGLGNHPELIRFFYRTGKAITADNVVTGHKEGGKVGPKTFNDFADKLYS